MTMCSNTLHFDTSLSEFLNNSPLAFSFSMPSWPELKGEEEVEMTYSYQPIRYKKGAGTRRVRDTRRTGTWKPIYFNIPNFGINQNPRNPNLLTVRYMRHMLLMGIWRTPNKINLSENNFRKPICLWTKYHRRLNTPMRHCCFMLPDIQKWL